MPRGGGPVVLPREAFGVRVRRGVLRGDLGGGGDVLDDVVDVVEVRHQLQPEGHLGGTVVVADAWLQPDVEVQLVLGVVLGPGHLLETVGFGVDELGVLGDRLVRVAGDKANREDIGG